MLIECPRNGTPGLQAPQRRAPAPDSHCARRPLLCSMMSGSHRMRSQFMWSPKYPALRQLEWYGQVGGSRFSQQLGMPSAG